MSIISSIIRAIVGEEVEPAVVVERFQPALDDPIELSGLWREGLIDREVLLEAAADVDDFNPVWVARYEGQNTLAGYIYAYRYGERLEVLDAQPADGHFAGHLLSAMLACVCEFARRRRLNLAAEVDEGSILEREVAARGFKLFEAPPDDFAGILGAGKATSGVVYTLDRFTEGSTE